MTTMTEPTRLMNAAPDAGELENVHRYITERAVCYLPPDDFSQSAVTQASYANRNDPMFVPAGLKERLEGYAASIGYSVEYRLVSDFHPGMEGSLGYAWHPDWLIVLEAHMSPASTVRVLTHEIAHAQLRHILTLEQRLMEAAREGEEIIAESVAAIVTGHLRVTTGDFSTKYLWRRGVLDAGALDGGILDSVRPFAVQLAIDILTDVAAMEEVPA